MDSNGVILDHGPLHTSLFCDTTHVFAEIRFKQGIPDHRLTPRWFYDKCHLRLEIVLISTSSEIACVDTVNNRGAVDTNCRNCGTVTDSFLFGKQKAFQL